MSIEGDEKWDVHCEDIGLDLINEVAGAWNVSAEPVETTMNRCLHDTGWSIGVNEIADRKRATKYESRTDSHYIRTVTRGRRYQSDIHVRIDCLNRREKIQNGY